MFNCDYASFGGRIKTASAIMENKNDTDYTQQIVVDAVKCAITKDGTGHVFTQKQVSDVLGMFNDALKRSDMVNVTQHSAGMGIKLNRNLSIEEKKLIQNSIKKAKVYL